jgi:hypothetical protein
MLPKNPTAHGIARGLRERIAPTAWAPMVYGQVLSSGRRQAVASVSIPTTAEPTENRIRGYCRSGGQSVMCGP